MLFVSKGIRWCSLLCTILTMEQILASFTAVKVYAGFVQIFKKDCE